MLSAVPPGQYHREFVCVGDVAMVACVVDGSEGGKGGGEEGKRDGGRQEKVEEKFGERRTSWRKEEEEGGGKIIIHLVFPPFLRPSFVPPSFFPTLSLISSLESLFPPLYPPGDQNTSYRMIHHKGKGCCKYIIYIYTSIHPSIHPSFHHDNYNYYNYNSASSHHDKYSLISNNTKSGQGREKAVNLSLLPSFSLQLPILSNPLQSFLLLLTISKTQTLNS
jgi:hypothetical protein